MNNFLPSDLLRHICRYYNPYEEIFNKCMKELHWLKIYDYCQYILRVRLFPSSKEELYVIYGKEDDSIHCVSLYELFSGEYKILMLTKAEFMELYSVQVIETMIEPHCDFRDNGALDNDWLIHKDEYIYLPTTLSNWEFNYDYYLERIHYQTD